MKSDSSIKEPFDVNGVRTFNTHSLEAYFQNKLYLEQELVVLFHNDDEEADDIFEALADLAREFRHRHVYKVVIGKINMNKNQVSDSFKIYSYPSVHLIFKSKDGQMLSHKIEAQNKRELVHLIF